MKTKHPVDSLLDLFVIALFFGALGYTIFGFLGNLTGGRSAVVDTLGPYIGLIVVILILLGVAGYEYKGRR